MSNLIDPASHELTLPYFAPPEGLTWPKASAAEIKKYIAVYESYDAALLALQDAEGELENATADDTLALVEAVSKEAPDPGTPNANKAQRALEYASERLRQKYREASTAGDSMLKQIRADSGDVVEQATEIERARLRNLQTAHKAISEQVQKANQEFSAFGSTVNGLEYVGIKINPDRIYGATVSASGITLPPLDEREHELVLERLGDVAIKPAGSVPIQPNQLTFD